MSQDLVGGQALIEGVMVRRGEQWAAACRRADGTIATTLQRSEPALGRARRIPLVRGIGALIDSLRIGMGAMRWSRDNSEPAASGSAASGGASPGPTLRERAIVAAVVTGVVAAFLIVPLWVAAMLHSVVGDGIGAVIVEGLVRLALFVGYLAMLSQLPGIRRTLEYHGAEHMVIAAHEHGVARGIAPAREFSVRHPRCGTDFFLLIFVISILAFALVGSLPAAWLVLSRILMTPVVVGVAYEILRAGGTSHHTRLAAVLAAPGLMLQRFTTREPADDQIEVALAALDTLVPPAARVPTSGDIVAEVSVEKQAGGVDAVRDEVQTPR